MNCYHKHFRIPLNTSDIICQSIGGNTQVSVTYILNHVVDYFPYGKVLREYKPGEAEKFLTTYHQRDEETGVDYRGARFYDSDIGRFLSMDPLAADFASWSAYNYVLGNPIIFVDPDGRAPDTIYKNEETDEEVEVNDGIDKTIEVNQDDFDKAKGFASRSEVANWIHTGNGWTQDDQKEYYSFYNSVNSYDGFSLANVYDYFTGGPDSGATPDSPMPVGGAAAKGITTLGGSGAGKYTISQVKKALKKAYEKLGVKSLPKFKKGKFGSPQRGNSKKGVRLDNEGHPNSPNPNEDGPHINWWDWSKGKKGKGGRHDAVKIE